MSGEGGATIPNTSMITGSETLCEPQQQDDWDVDPANPHNWSKTFRWFYTLMVSVLVVAVAFGSSVITGEREGGVETTFHVSATVSALQVSLMVCGFGVGPLLWSPLSETFGRKPVYMVAMFLYVVFNLPCALAPNLGSLLVGRFLCGVTSSVTLTLAGGSISDLFPPAERGNAIAYFAAAPYAGPVLGPIVGGWIWVGTQSWRWIYWVNMMLSGAMWILVCCLPETYGPILRERRNRKLGIDTEKQASNAPTSNKGQSFAEMVKTTLIRPLVMLFTEPILLCMSLYIAIIYALLYAFFGSYPIVFGYRDLSSGIVGLLFIGVLIGVAFALLCTPQFERYYRRSKQTPEDRLIGMMFAAPFIPISLFIFGWTSPPRLIWVGPAAAGIPFGFGMVLVYYAANNYIIDCFSQYCASALAAKTLVRSGGGAAFPLFIGPMYARLGSEWASTLLAFISLAIVPIPFVFYKWGPAIRARTIKEPPKEELEDPTGMA